MIHIDIDKSTSFVSFFNVLNRECNKSFSPPTDFKKISLDLGIAIQGGPNFTFFPISSLTCVSDTIPSSNKRTRTYISEKVNDANEVDYVFNLL